ncbi:MAG: ATP-binding protein [Sulfurimonas sp.]|nr:ATP-binding protein [Sulfurimonas sp.]
MQLNHINNVQKINPPLYLELQRKDIKDKTLLYVYVPQSSQVHRLNGKIFDRNGDSDLDITNNTNQVASMYIQKQNYFSESKVFHHISMDDLEPKLFDRARIMAKNNNHGMHTWETMSDMEILKSSGLYKKDVETSKEGITLAGILLFGKDLTIQNAIPFHKIDAILREAIVNLLMHREYSNLFVSKLIIQKDKVVFENANKATEFKEITLENFTPFPKNPSIAKVFREIGFAEELGSGVRNMFKYSKAYGGSDPKILEEKVFTTTILLHELENHILVNDQATPQAEAQAELNMTELKILDLLETKDLSSQELVELLSLKSLSGGLKKAIKNLLNLNLIALTIPDKPKSPNQKYKSV